MFVKSATTSIKTIDLFKNIFFISRSCRQRYSVAPLIYKLQAGKNDIKEIKLPGELGGAELENKISMLTDDTQLFNKYERYVGK